MNKAKAIATVDDSMLRIQRAQEELDRVYRDLEDVKEWLPTQSFGRVLVDQVRLALTESALALHKERSTIQALGGRVEEVK